MSRNTSNMTTVVKPGFVHPPPIAMANSSHPSKPSSSPTSDGLHSISDVYFALKNFSKPGVLSPDETSRVILVVLELLTDGVSKDALLFCSRFLTKEDYEEVVDERNIIHHCGFPLCNNDPRGIRQAHQINFRRPSMILPSTYLSKYCCREHHQASLFYQAQLSDVPVYSRKDITYVPYGHSYEGTIALLDDVESRAKAENKSLAQVIHEFSSLSIGLDGVGATTNAVGIHANGVDLAATLESLTLKERDPTVARLDAAGPDEPVDIQPSSSAIEGYVTKYH